MNVIVTLQALIDFVAGPGGVFFLIFLSLEALRKW
jgi:hypothetical protein